MRVVNHKDHKKSNNCVENLEWVSQRQNILFTYKKKGTRNGNRRKRKVKCLKTGKIYFSIKEAANILGCSQSTICNKCKKEEILSYVRDADIKDEIWKKHPIYDIKVSNMGRYMTKMGNKTSGYKSSTGYCTLKVGTKSLLVHRLVAETFLPQSNTLLQVNHIDLNGYNNAVTNLEWITQSQNIKHSFANQTYKKRTRCDQNDLPGEIWKRHPTLDMNVSSKGRVSVNNVKSYGCNDKGYMRKKMHGKTYRVHRLVAETFLYK